MKTSTLTFIKQVQQEIKKVTWPTRRETMVTSLMVIILSVIASMFFLAVDGTIAFVVGSILG